jgi:hypothetical protein
MNCGTLCSREMRSWLILLLLSCTFFRRTRYAKASRTQSMTVESGHHLDRWDLSPGPNRPLAHPDTYSLFFTSCGAVAAAALCFGILVCAFLFSFSAAGSRGPRGCAQGRSRSSLTKPRLLVLIRHSRAAWLSRTKCVRVVCLCHDDDDGNTPSKSERGRECGSSN